MPRSSGAESGFRILGIRCYKLYLSGTLPVRCNSLTNQNESCWACDNQVKEGYMIESKLQPNESDPEDKMTKTDLKRK